VLRGLAERHLLTRAAATAATFSPTWTPAADEALPGSRALREVSVGLLPARLGVLDARDRIAGREVTDARPDLLVAARDQVRHLRITDQGAIRDDRVGQGIGEESLNVLGLGDSPSSRDGHSM